MKDKIQGSANRAAQLHTKPLALRLRSNRTGRTTVEGSTPFFAEQVTLSQVPNIVAYASGTVDALMVAAGLLLIAAATTRRKNHYNSTIEKTMGFFIGFATYYCIGFGFWAAQYYFIADATLMDSI